MLKNRKLRRMIWRWYLYLANVLWSTHPNC
ncbi:hypothetical protein IHE45_04G040300 [Dioscorea alata]|uniref:Uncharacterized protein n=1 Tax=Dioscorea alata TaxID=55571 RepID=A0ACB7WBY7_DIOAL|nr:hypothetical protein IHE45_04G040300 [Dioscorea alata]